VTEAARATSAAPTFFPVQKIGKRYFVDGGMEYNNPSQAIFSHYTE
jgi:patatin-like phospholipase/acyl hydrolase